MDSFEDHIAWQRLKFLLKLSPRFSSFYPQIKSKVQKKLKKTQNAPGQQRNLKHELEVLAILVNDGRFGVDYEPSDDGPDISVTFDGASFWVEVTEIGESRRHIEFDQFIDELNKQLRTIEERYVVDLHWKQAFEPFHGDITKIRRETTEIYDKVRFAIAEGALETTFPVIATDGRLSFTVRHLPTMVTPGVYANCVFGPVLSRPHPAKKILDVLLEKYERGQFRADESTILVMRTMSIDLDDFDTFKEAMHNWGSSHGGTPDDPAAQANFLRKFSGLSGVLLQHSWRGTNDSDGNFLCINSGGNTVPASVWDFFDSMPLWLSV